VPVTLYETGPEAETAAELLVATGRRVELRVAASGEVCADRFRLWSAPEYLVTTAARMPVRRALCLACGVGREAIHLAAAGWQVIAIDRLPDAIERGRLLEERYVPEGNPRIEWLISDLRKPLPVHLGQFDLVCELFAWQPTSPTLFHACLTPSGTGLWEGFANRPEADAVWPDLHVTECPAGLREGRTTKRILLHVDESVTVRD
jgi:SAM-dependent methyltransferase